MRVTRPYRRKPFIFFIAAAPTAAPAAAGATPNIPEEDLFGDAEFAAFEEAKNAAEAAVPTKAGGLPVPPLVTMGTPVQQAAGRQQALPRHQGPRPGQRRPLWMHGHLRCKERDTSRWSPRHSESEISLVCARLAAELSVADV